MPKSAFQQFVGLVAVLTVLPVCALAQDSSPVQVEKYTAPIKVACVGDSITAGFGAGRGNAWPDQLRKVLGKRWDVRNFGVSGKTLMNSGDSPYQKCGSFQAAKDFGPDVVVIILGTNDTKPQNWANFKKDFEADYRDMVSQFVALPGKPRIYVAYPPYIAHEGSWGINEPNTAEEIPVIAKLAKDMKLGVIDVHGALKGKDDLIPDKVHPNAQGQTVIARAVLAALTGYTGDFPPTAVVLASSEKAGSPWRYTVEKPADDWVKADFDASKWKEGPGGFGVPVAEGSTARTEWKTDHIWLRKDFTLDKALNNPKIWMRHDDDAEVYLDGVLAVRAGKYNDGYADFGVSDEALAALKPGKHVIAVHCRQTGGGQYIDAGIIDILPVTLPPKP